MDTTREMEEMQNTLWMERSVDERAEMMFGMFACARSLMISSLPDGLSESQLKEQIFSKTRRNDAETDVYHRLGGFFVCLCGDCAES
jgi:hypothetical protein